MGADLQRPHIGFGENLRGGINSEQSDASPESAQGGRRVNGISGVESLIHPAVARAHFEGLRNEIGDAAQHAADQWKLVYAEFPHLCIHVLATTGQPSMGILIDASDWPHRPLSFLPTDLGFLQVAPYDFIPKKTDEAGRQHIVCRLPDARPWFCVIGTREYHEHYGQVVPWEAIRHLPSNAPAVVLQACVDQVDRKALVPMGQQPIWAAVSP